jgi:Cu+-exporting ATPase
MKPFILSFVVVLVGLAGPAVAAEPAKVTITMSDLDCPSCAKKVTTKLVEVPGVAKVETNHETGISVVTFKDKAVVSPKALWEAVEKAKKTPVKLEGPSGTFTEKPKA